MAIQYRNISPLLVFTQTVLFCVAASPTAFATGPDSETIIKVERAFNNTKRIEADFTQTIKSKGFGVTGSYSGRVFLQKPDLMRWEYDQPKGRVLVADGKKLWFFDPEEGIVRVGALSDIMSETSPAYFLAGEAKLTELFVINLAPPLNDDTMNVVRLRLSPIKPISNVKAMLLEVNGADYKIMALSMIDYLGNINRIDFLEAKTPSDKERIEESRFEFKPPPGAPIQKMAH